MSKFRVMSYNLSSTRQGHGDATLDLCSSVIREQAPDVVLVQHLDTSRGRSCLHHLAELSGMPAYGSGGDESNAFLSLLPLHNLQSTPLGFGDTWIRADLDRDQERVHLVNLTLSWNPLQRVKQVKKVFDEQLLGGRSFPCATVIGGDFGLPLWGCGQVVFNPDLVRAGQPAWRADYPASFPLWGRGRIYFQGPIRAVSGLVVRTKTAQKASNQLPLVLDVETFDTRKTLKLKDQTKMASNHPKPVCG